jgi:hypothetical protein
LRVDTEAKVVDVKEEKKEETAVLEEEKTELLYSITKTEEGCGLRITKMVKKVRPFTLLYHQQNRAAVVYINQKNESKSLIIIDINLL